MKEQILRELVRIVRDELMDKGAVSIPSMGTFSVEHEPPRRKDEHGGHETLTPPRDVIHFTPDN